MKQWIRFILAATLPVATAAAGPGLINYQGRLTNLAGTPVTVATNVTFTLWGAASGGTQLGGGFSDTDVVTPDTHGLYSTEIGDDGGTTVPASVFENDPVYLNVNIAGEDLTPRLRITSAGYAADADTLQGRDAAAFLNMSADAYVVVKTTASPTQNAVNLLTAYTAAKALTPNSGDKTTTNRAVVVVPPARYDLGAGSFALDAEFVDVVGLTSDREAQYVMSSANVLLQTAADVRIENLTLHYTGGGSTNFAYKPVGGSPAATVICNCSFKATFYSMMIGVQYAGKYDNCVATGERAFGGGSGGIASGTFTACTATGLGAFGGSAATASGSFFNCTGGAISFGGATNGVASGTFTQCTGGAFAFGGGGGTASGGKFNYCIGGLQSFTESGATAPLQFFCVQDGTDYVGNNRYVQSQAMF